MRFDIDYSQAKTMATRLQSFLEGSSKKLTRSSAIKAIAQILGFNNRNEMAARITFSHILCAALVDHLWCLTVGSTLRGA